MTQIRVYTLVGEWVKDSVTGEWDFRESGDYEGKEIDISVIRCYEDLVSLLADSFEIDTEENTVSLTYWTVNETIIFTHPPTDQFLHPPVDLKDDDDLANFLIVRGRRLSTNLFVTLRLKSKLNEGVSGKVVDEERYEGFSLSQELPIDGSMLDLIDKMEAEYRKKRRLGEWGSDTDGSGLTGSRTMVCMNGVCTGVEGCCRCPRTPIMGKKGPTSSDSGWSGGNVDGNMYVAASAEVGNTPVTPVGTLGDRKGKGIMVDGQSAETDRCMFPRFDLGIDELHTSDDVFSGEGVVGIGIPDTFDSRKFPTSLFVDPPPQMTYFPSAEEHGLIHIGCVFPDKKDFHLALSLWSLENYFCFKIQHSDRTRIFARCVDTNCGWRVSCKCFRDFGSVEIKKIVHRHTCGAAARARYVEKATARILAQLLNSKYANGKQGPRACEVSEVVLNEMKVQIKYMKAWYTREIAVMAARGKEEENFRLLSRYLRALVKANLGTLTDVMSTKDNAGNKQFLFLFVALYASMAGWPNVRKVIGIDGTHIKGKYKGCLVAACCQDGNFQILPLAIGVVDSENIDSWVWFLENLTQIVTDDPDVVFISDRHPAIYAAVKKVYPLSTHVCCVVHLFRNVIHLCKCGGLANMVNRCARAYTKSDFRYWWRQIENISPECALYLTNEGLSYWARSYCTKMRYNLMSRNICESFNHAIGEAVEYPIISMVDFLRTLLMRWCKERRDETGKCHTKCTPNVEKTLVESIKEASDMKAIAADRYIFQVNDVKGWSHIVDLKKGCCTCNAFQSLEIPCCHALAAIRVDKNDIYSYVGKHYLSDTWTKIFSEVIHPVPSNYDVDSDDTCECEELLPPKTRRPSGRPRKTRI